MALLRMTAIALVACSPAAAEPASRGGHAPPAGWQQLPSIATAVGAAVRAEDVTIEAVDAWGEPALGCYAVWLALHGGTAGAPALAEQVLDGFRGAPGPRGGAGGPRQGAAGSQEAVSVGEVVKPVGPEGVLAFAFARPPYRGRVRAQLGTGRITAIACFGNHREPIACEATCTRVLEGVAQGGPGSGPGSGPGNGPGSGPGSGQ